MKRNLLRVLPLVLGVVLILAFAINASAAFEDFTDVEKHWARDTLRKAYEDEILYGYDDTTMAPNGSVTKAQAITILCRVLNVTGRGDISALEIPDNAWFAEDASRAVYAGMLDDSDAGTMKEPITRGEAFCLMLKAFQLAKADPDYRVLDEFSDGLFLSGEVRSAVACLAEDGIIVGSNGKLKCDEPLTRAEFVTILYRLADTYVSASGFNGQAGTGAVLSGPADLRRLSLNKVWLDCESSSVYLEDLSANLLAVRSDELNYFAIDGSGRIDRLILAPHSGDVNFYVPDGYTIGTLVVGDGSGTVTVTSPLDSIEVTGDGRTVVIDNNVKRLSVSASEAKVTLASGCAAEEVVIHGEKNSLTLNGKADSLLLAGRDSAVDGQGSTKLLTLKTRYYAFEASAEKEEEWKEFDLSGVEVELRSPAKLPAGETLHAAADVTVPDGHEGKLCTASWYLNGALISQEKIVLGARRFISDIQPEYNHALVQDGKVLFVISYENGDGDDFTVQDSADVYLENVSDLGLADASVRLTAPAELPPGETLTVTAAVDTPEKGQICDVYWYVDGKEIKTDKLLLGGDPVSVSHQYEYTYNMPETSVITCKVTYTTSDGRAQEISGEAALTVHNYPDYGIDGATVSLSAPDTLEAGKVLEVTANLTYQEAGKECTGTWYVDGTAVSTQTILLGTDVPTLSHSFTYTEDMAASAEILFILSYTTQDGRAQEISDSVTVGLMNYGPAYYHPETAVELVTDQYAGDYTLEWALANDYSPELKTAWINHNGYASSTEYLLWVNLTYQRVNIFSGSAGNWTLIRECLCGTGKPSTPTIRGVFTTSYKQNAWNYGSYYCGPIVRFKGSSGYAFHSRLEYWPMGSGRFYDGRIGFPISHGCIRMYDPDIWWIYENIPSNTTVVVH